MLKGSMFLVLLIACTVVQSAEGETGRRPSAAPAALRVFSVPGRPGETCVVLVDARNVPLVRRCSYDRLSG